MGQRVIKGMEELKGLTGQEVAVSDWFEVAQNRINDFAGVTGDHQWIHVDVERARTASRFTKRSRMGF
jgi:acyl dehydratase